VTPWEENSLSAEADPVEWTRLHWEELSLPDPDRFAAVGSVLRLREAIVAVFNRQLRAFQINRSMYFVLVTLALSRAGGLRLRNLSEYVLVHPTTMTLVIDELDKRGLTRREPDPMDRRAILAIITPAGRAVMNEATRALAEVGFGLGVLTPEEVERLAYSVGLVRRALEGIEA
jgi:DNA-binding MarR family transcriptional regulator